MQKLVIVDKPIGLTPLQVIDTLRLSRPEFIDKKIAYAGRLDPLAHGVMLLMVGDETKKRDKYFNLPKTYEFKAVFGFQTDSYDLLGYAQKSRLPALTKNVKLIVNLFVNKMIGKQFQSYPPYSSKTVQGKPLFWYARNGKLHDITIPKREIEIYEFTCLNVSTITIQTLGNKIKDAVKSVSGDFRQEIITKRWNHLLASKKNQNELFPTATFRIHCSSGTYIRALVQQLGIMSTYGAVTFSIERTTVGDYTLKQAWKL